MPRFDSSKRKEHEKYRRIDQKRLAQWERRSFFFFFFLLARLFLLIIYFLPLKQKETKKRRKKKKKNKRNREEKKNKKNRKKKKEDMSFSYLLFCRLFSKEDEKGKSRNRPRSLVPRYDSLMPF